MAAPQNVDATAMQMPEGDPARLPSQMASTTPSVNVSRDKTSNPVGTCMRMVPLKKCGPIEFFWQGPKLEAYSSGRFRRCKPLFLANNCLLLNRRYALGAPGRVVQESDDASHRVLYHYAQNCCHDGDA